MIVMPAHCRAASFRVHASRLLGHHKFMGRITAGCQSCSLSMRHLSRCEMVLPQLLPCLPNRLFAALGDREAETLKRVPADRWRECCVLWEFAAELHLAVLTPLNGAFPKRLGLRATSASGCLRLAFIASPPDSFC